MQAVDHADDFYFEDDDLRQWEKRHFLVSQMLIDAGFEKVADFGCNDGKFLRRLTNDRSFSLLVGVDIDANVLESGKTRLEPDASHYLFKKERVKKLEIKLIQGDILFPSGLLKRLAFEAITAIEVVEHLYPEDLPAFEKTLFGFYQPKCVIVTTPNIEFNEFFGKNPDNTNKIKLRHFDHKFEFTRKEFNTWAASICKKHGYTVEISGIGLPRSGDSSKGFCTQVAKFLLNNPKSSVLPTPQLETHKEHCSFIYPFCETHENIKHRVIEELKYGYNFFRYYGKLKSRENGFISIERICSLNKIESLLKNAEKKIFDILTVFDLERENIVLNAKRTHLRINYKSLRPFN